MENLGLQKHLSKTFIWMFVGIMITAIVSWFAAQSLDFQLLICENPACIFFAFIVELILVIMFNTMGINQMNPTLSKILYVLYSSVTGLTFSVIFLVYELGSIWLAFVVTSLYFGALALFGYKTSIDLTKFASIAIFGLIFMIVTELILIIIGFRGATLLFAGLGIIIFSILTAFDVQKIKILYEQNKESEIGLETIALYSAFQLYLDFINLFLEILKFFGKRRD